MDTLRDQFPPVQPAAADSAVEPSPGGTMPGLHAAPAPAPSGADAATIVPGMPSAPPAGEAPYPGAPSYASPAPGASAMPSGSAAGGAPYPGAPSHASAEAAASATPSAGHAMSASGSPYASVVPGGTATPSGSVAAPAPGGAPAIDVAQLTEEVRQSSAFLDDVFAQVGQVVVGQREMVERVMIGLLTGGHCLIEGVPGLAKTLTVKTLSQTINASFQRIQFTPDLLPADITGTIIYNMHTGQFTQKRGPLFANLVLADEVNRAPAKVQSALLEAMQERQVTIGDTTHPLPDPFLVLATQNPIEQEGTFPLPEAQLDRFMLLIRVNYPTASDERAMLDRMSTLDVPTAREVTSIEQVRLARRVVSKIYIDDRVRDYIVHVVQATRKPRDYGLGELAPLIEYGGSPRATLSLAQAARAHAFIRHRAFVTPDDIKAIALDVLRHRVTVTYEAEAEEVTSDDVVRRIFEYLPVP